MKLPTLFLTLAFATLSLVTISFAGPIALADNSPSVQDLTYRDLPVILVPTFTGNYGGHDYELNGTLEEVDAQLKVCILPFSLSCSIFIL